MSKLTVWLVAVLVGLWLPGPALAEDSPYPLHHNVLTTMFYVGELPSADNGYIDNLSSSWASDWVAAFGCVDDPNYRVGYLPANCFADGQMGPLENPFYVALPFGDYDQNGVLPQVNEIPWYQDQNGDHVYAEGGSLLKNRWVEITFTNPQTQQTRTAYAQWQDVGPFRDNDGAYVWGDAESQYEVGLDVSPAVNDYLGLSGQGHTSWRFIQADQVPDGWWRAVVTTSDPNWSQSGLGAEGVLAGSSPQLATFWVQLQQLIPGIFVDMAWRWLR